MTEKLCDFCKGTFDKKCFVEHKHLTTDMRILNMCEDCFIHHLKNGYNLS
mgnify:CR=1 FL=1